MILTYHEGACIRATARETTLVFGPVSKLSKKFKPTNFGADIAFIPLDHEDMNGIEEAGRGDRQPFAVFGPGEYEVSGSARGGKEGKESSSVTATGHLSRSRYPSGDERINTIYSVHFDGLSVLYLGAQADMELPPDVLEMDPPDVLVIPIGGEGALSPADAQKLSVNLEAKIVIPILYDQKSLKQFLKEAGEEAVMPQDKLTLKPRDVIGKENEVVVLSS